FVRCLDALLDAECQVGVATHDEWLLGESLARISRRGLRPLEYELQMLLGVREERRDELVAEGHRLRVYVPFGEHWYRYSLRRLAKLGVTGEDAVEIALRTALLATGRPGIVAFDGAYHGTGLLALAATGFERFRAPFAAWLPGPVHRRTYGEDPGPLPGDAGCVIVEPVQGRAGSRVPPDGFLETLRRRCDEAGAVLVVDSIYAGLGRVGELWPGEQVADVLCVGKALGGGLPLSAALFYREGLEAAWRLGPEDVYTHTHVGNPLACAAGLVVLDEVPKLLDRVRDAGERFEQAGWHGRGLLRAREGDADEALVRGVLVVPAGPDGSLIQATPP